MSRAGFIERLRQPEYTGANRCAPCTVLNVAIGVGVAALVAALVHPAVGAAALAVALVAIYLRGYLVPRTPELTKRYLPRSVLRAFGKEPPAPGATGVSSGHDRAAATDASSDDDRISEVDPERALATAGVLRECPDEDDVCLTEGFREAWWEHIRAARDDEDTMREYVADVVEFDPDRLVFVKDDVADILAVRVDDENGEELGFWMSTGAFLADVAAAQTVSQRHPDWDDFDVDARNSVLTSLRIFIDSCPECEGAVAVGEEEVESCCWSGEATVARCTECDAQYFEVMQGGVETGGADGPPGRPDERPV